MPQSQVGILSMADLLKQRFVSPIKLGLDTVIRSLQADLAIHNRITQDLLVPFTETSDDRRRRYGVSGSIDFVSSDEFSRAHTQKTVTGSEVEFPMQSFQAAVGWTAQFFKNKSVADMAMTQNAIKIGHVKKIRAELQKAIFGATNYSVLDYLVDNVSLDVKRFVNADSAPIPMGPNGEAFDATTHTHYLFHDLLTNASAHSLVDTVNEHYNDGSIKVFVNAADEAAWRALADFKPYVDSRLTIPVDVSSPTTRLNPFKTNDRAIGLFGPAEVWVKPWALSGYAVAMDIATGQKPLVLRTPDGSGIKLETVATNVLFPIQADFMESVFGFGTWNRTNGAVLYHGAGAVAYVAPVIA